SHHRYTFTHTVPFHRNPRTRPVDPSTVTARADRLSCDSATKTVPFNIWPFWSTSCPCGLNFTSVADPKATADELPNASGVSGTPDTIRNWTPPSMTVVCSVVNAGPGIS